jgi:hypothetical protein
VQAEPLKSVQSPILITLYASVTPDGIFGWLSETTTL